MTLTIPEPLRSDHDSSQFSCGEPSLDDWLKRHALKNQTGSTSRTYVTCEGTRIAGYYTLAAASILRAQATRTRNMPATIPMILLGRLAVDTTRQRQGLARALFRHAAERAAEAAEIIGARGVLVHALNDSVKQFYVALGFDESPLHPLMLMISMADLRAAIQAAR
jgi:GNAT superfamily N-acetyltransferase